MVLVSALISGGGVWLVGSKKGEAAGVVWVVGRGAAVGIRQIDEYPYGKITGGGQLRILDTDKHSLFSRVAVNDAGQFAGGDARFSRKRFCNTHGRPVRDAYSLFDVESDVGPLSDSLLELLKRTLGRDG